MIYIYICDICAKIKVFFVFLWLPMLSLAILPAPKNERRGTLVRYFCGNISEQ